MSPTAHAECRRRGLRGCGWLRVLRRAPSSAVSPNRSDPNRSSPNRRGRAEGRDRANQNRADGYRLARRREKTQPRTRPALSDAAAKTTDTPNRGGGVTAADKNLRKPTRAPTSAEPIALSPRAKRRRSSFLEDIIAASNPTPGPAAREAHPTAGRIASDLPQAYAPASARRADTHSQYLTPAELPGARTRRAQLFLSDRAVRIVWGIPGADPRRDP